MAGKPLLSHVIDTARGLAPSRLCVIYGHGGAAVLKLLDGYKVSHAVQIDAAEQAQQLGTGHAVQQALPLLDDSVPTLILYGDVPLTSAASLQQLVEAAGTDKLAILTVEQDDPFGLGRIVREARRHRAHRRGKGRHAKQSAPSAKSTAASWSRPPCT